MTTFLRVHAAYLLQGKTRHTEIRVAPTSDFQTAEMWWKRAEAIVTFLLKKQILLKGLCCALPIAFDTFKCF
jgi:hypothetical protein